MIINTYIMFHSIIYIILYDIIVSMILVIILCDTNLYNIMTYDSVYIKQYIIIQFICIIVIYKYILWVIDRLYI